MSFYSASGIAYAADNAVTVQTLSGDKRADNQKKVFAVPNVGMNGGVVGCFGAAEVGAEDMEPWMTGTITRWTGSPHPADFGDFLCAALNADFGGDETPTGFHTGAFENRNGIAVPVMQYVTNINDSPSEGFTSGEHFPSHPQGNGLENVPPEELRAKLHQQELNTSLPWWFRNGEVMFSSGAWEGLRQAIRAITELPDEDYRLPNDITKWGHLAQILIRTNAELMALLLPYGDTTIGEPEKPICIRWPSS